METSVQLLLDALHPAAPLDSGQLARLSPDQWQDLVALAASQRVRPLLWQRLQQKGATHLLPDEAASSLREFHKRNTMRNLGRYAELHRLLAALQTEGIPVILLKGIYLAEAVYAQAGLREMSDIDLLARPGDHQRIVEILACLGYVSSPPTYSDNHIPPMVKEGCASFEIHWNLVELGDPCRIDPACWWRNAMPVRIAGSEALALSPENLLLHLCIHASYQHQFDIGLRPYLDLAATIDHFASVIDWPCLIERAEEWGCRRGIYLPLRLAQELVGANLPAGFLERLCPEEMAASVLAIARAQIFHGVAVNIPVSFASFLAGKSFKHKINMLWQRIFMSKAKLSQLYSVPVDSLRIYPCYLQRIAGLLRRHAPTLKKFRQDDDGRLHAMVARKNSLATWLSG